MRRSSILLFLLLVSAGALKARADSVGLATVTFTCTTTCPIQPTAPPISTTTPDLQVTWDGYLFNFSSKGFSFFSRFNPGAQYNWQLMPVTFDVNGVTNYWVYFVVSAGPDPGHGFGYGIGQPVSTDAFNEASGEGNLLFTPAVTPEPSTLVLMSSGIGLLFVWRKQNLSLCVTSFFERLRL